jgi:general secretion pathway protein G
MTMYRKRQNGFSLLELLAVVTILGIIAAVILARFSSSTDHSKEQVRKHHAAAIHSAVERFALENGRLPNTLAEIDNTDNFPDGLPEDPVTGAGFIYNSTTGRVNY